MTLTILYWDYERPDEAMISSQENFAAMVDQFEQRGCVVEKITAKGTKTRSIYRQTARSRTAPTLTTTRT
jgi:hypothetical protein